MALYACSTDILFILLMDVWGWIRSHEEGVLFLLLGSLLLLIFGVTSGNNPAEGIAEQFHHALLGQFLVEDLF